jgi:multicomponent Na+:H+ antiporter subunit D
MQNNLIPLLVVIPLGGAFICPLAAKILKEDFVEGAVQMVAVLATSMAMLLAAGTLVLEQWPEYWMGKWSHPVGICLVVDGLTELLLVTVNMVALLSCIFSLSYMRRYTNPGLYYSMFLLMLAGMNGAVLAGDLFNLYVFLEVAAVASYGLVAFGCESEELEASFKYLVLGSIGSAFILFGIAILYNLTGQLNMAKVSGGLAQLGSEAHSAVLLAGAMFLAGFSLKAAMVPFHAWLPDAHPSAPAPISAMLSGVLIKAIGIYALIRVVFSVFGVSPLYGQVLIAMGSLSMIVGVLLAVGQWDFKRLLAYHSISQMGYVLLAVGVGVSVLSGQDGEGGQSRQVAIAGLAVFGGLFHLFNHATFKSLLFLCAGSVEYATGTRLLKELGGLKQKCPVTSGCCRVAALSIAGVPPFNGFWSKLIIIIACAAAGYWWLAALAVLVAFLTLLSFVKVQRYILEGDPAPAVEQAREVPFAMCTAMVILALLCVLGGLAAPWLQNNFIGVARDCLVKLAEQGGTMLGGIRP